MTEKQWIETAAPRGGFLYAKIRLSRLGPDRPDVPGDRLRQDLACPSLERDRNEGDAPAI